MENENKYDVVIIGGGVTGASLLCMLSCYTNVKRIALIEKYGALAEINSHYNNNSQTLHFGDIETNYGLEKAKQVKEAAEMIKAYIEKHSGGKKLFNKTYKMVLGIGERETEELEKRHEEFKPFFPKLEKIEKEEISRIEPAATEGRSMDEKILALYSPDGYAINYKNLAESFVEEAMKANSNVEVFLKTKAERIEKNGDLYRVIAKNGIFEAKTVVTAGGAYSLIFAKSLGYGKEYGILPVAGNFYRGKNILRGKIYRPQIPGLPFAAVHGDPDVNNPSETRFGPTAMVLPLLERHHWDTSKDFIKLSILNIEVLASIIRVLTRPAFIKFGLKNIIYEIPVIGKLLFLKDARKIVPALKYSDIELAKGKGGIRPQLVDIKEKKFILGEAKIIGEKIIFDITPSPGASVSLKNAEKSARKIVEFLGKDYRFDEEKFRRDFYK